MSVYYTKCGMQFNKGTNAATTGYSCATDESGQLIEKCKLCNFPELKRKGNLKFYECRAGNCAPSLINTLMGNLNDMNKIMIYSLNTDFCDEIFKYAEADPELVPYYCKDRADCRKVISIACSKNKKGIAAKKNLAARFFHVNAGD